MLCITHVYSLVKRQATNLRKMYLHASNKAMPISATEGSVTVFPWQTMNANHMRNNVFEKIFVDVDRALVLSHGYFEF